MTNRTRREFVGRLLLASIGGILPASKQGTSGVKSSAAGLHKRDFAPVRHWQGTLTNDGAKMQVRLKIESSDSAALRFDDKPAEKITEMRLEGVAFTGTSIGLIDSPDARHTGTKTLKLKLIPHEGMLVGRLLVTDSKTVMLPCVLSLNRVPA